jgi:CRP-like cAMP-binding protein
MAQTAKPAFDPKSFLAKVGGGKTHTDYQKSHKIFSQGESRTPSITSRKAKLSSQLSPRQGKEAVIAILGVADFFGEGCLAGQPMRMSTVTTITESSIVRIEKADTVRVLHEEPAFSEMFLHYLLSRNIRIEEDLVDPPLQLE